MAFKFTDARRYPYKPGNFFLGLDLANDPVEEVGITTERHLMTIAGAGSGKGAALLVPNLKRWKGSAVVVDPKGENATLTAEDRAAMGQLVGIVDPYHIVTGSAARFRVSINPLSALDPKSRSYRKDVEAFADGTIMRHDPKHETWVKAARTMIGGGIDLMQSEDGPPEDKTLPALRRMFLQPPEILRAWAESMLAADTPARLAPEAGALLLEKLDSPESVPAQTYGSNLLPALGWIGDPAFDEVWHGLPPFDLRKLKEGNTTLYLVLPPDALGPRGAFLRLFVSMTLNVMMSDLAQKNDARCLFLLDEFYSLGSLDIVAQAMGLMRGYGVQLWPFLQDIGQLRKLYGDDLSGTFFANADAHIFFGNSDAQTLGYISERIGNFTTEDLPEFQEISFGDFIKKNGINPNDEFHREDIKEMRRAHHQSEMERLGEHRHLQSSHLGRPRIPPEKVKERVAKKPGFPVARGMIVVAQGSDILYICPSPYFKPTLKEDINRATEIQRLAAIPPPPQKKWYQSPFAPPVVGLLVFGLFLDAVPDNPAKAVPPALVTAAAWWWWNRPKKPA